MSLVQNFQTSTSLPNQIALNWEQPVGFNTSGSEIIVTRTISHFPMELFNTSFPNRATDPRGVEIFRGSTIVGLNPLTISVTANVLTDTSATFPLSPNLKGRLLRDSNSSVFRILSNTGTSVTLSGNPANGIYVILPDFPNSVRDQQNFEIDVRTTVGPGLINNPVELINGSLVLATFKVDELVNLIFVDGSGTKFIVKSNTTNSITFFESVTPTIGVGMALLNSYKNSSLQPYIDKFKNDVEALNRVGTGLQNDQFYYYTAFINGINLNVAQANSSLYKTSTSTQSVDISTKDRAFGNILFNQFWPIIFRQLDSNGDLEDLMQVFGSQFNTLYSYINTYNLQDSDNVYVNALLPLSEQFGLASIGFSIGIDTLRRIARNLITAWKLKGSKEGIALFIRIITTWDITNGTGDFSSAISDFLPNIQALRFFDPLLGTTNTRLTVTSPVFTPGGRFAKSLPGIIIPGFFTFREFVVNIPNVALFIGKSTNLVVTGNNSVLTDITNNFGATNSLVGNFLVPNQGEPNNVYKIIANTATTITVDGLITNGHIGDNYVILSPLNTNRLLILNKLLPSYIPYGTVCGFNFIIT